MRARHLLRKRDYESRHPGHVDWEEVTRPLNEAASIDDRIVSVPDPDEQIEPVKKKQAIVSVNGKDVDTIVPDEDRAA